MESNQIQTTPIKGSNGSSYPSSGQTKTSAKDFFLHLGTIVGLYTVTISFINLLFKVINKAFPEVGSSVYSWGGGSEISLPVATLIVFFPIFIVLSRTVHNIYTENPAKKDLAIRKWLTYITLFVTGIVLAGDLVTVLYKFLDGQDLSTAFVFKALVVLLVAGIIFWFYIQDIRDKVSAGSRKVWSIGVGIVILVAIILGFSVLGSPKSQRLGRYDGQKINDLQNIQWQVINYWQMNGKMPSSLDEVEKQQYGIIAKDPQTKVSYEYRSTGNLTFELCAEFNNRDMTNQYQYADVAPASYPIGAKGVVIQNNNWNHDAGRQCFSRTIDQIAYPTQIKR